MGDDARIEGIQLHQGVLPDVDLGDLVDGHLGLHDERGIVGHDVHQGLARADHAAAGVDLEVDHLAADGGLDLQPFFGIAQGADAFAGLDDLVLQLAGFAGGFFHEAVAQVFHAQAQFGIPLFGFGDGLAQAAPFAHMAGQVALQLQDLGFFQIAFLVKLALGPQLLVEGADDGGLGPGLILKAAHLGLELGYLGLQQGKLAVQGVPAGQKDLLLIVQHVRAVHHMGEFHQTIGPDEIIFERLFGQGTGMRSPLGYQLFLQHVFRGIHLH